MGGGGGSQTGVAQQENVSGDAEKTEDAEEEDCCERGWRETWGWGGGGEGEEGAAHRQQARSQRTSAVTWRRLRMQRRKTMVSMVGVRHRGQGGGEGRGGSSEAAGMQPENIAGDTEKMENGEVEDYGEHS